MAIRKILILYLLLFFPVILNISAQDYQERIYESYIKGDMDAWYQTILEMEKGVEITSSMKLQYDLVVARYGYIAYLISARENKAARNQISTAEDELQKLLLQSPGDARYHALLGAVYGFTVKTDPYKAAVFGRRALRANDRAFELAPGNPKVWMEKGNIEMFKPAVFGSDPSVAAQFYEKAVSLFEEDPNSYSFNWLYLNTLRNLADAYIAAYQLKKADETFKKMLSAEPNLRWVRDREYPMFREKYAQQLGQ